MSRRWPGCHRCAPMHRHPRLTALEGVSEPSISLGTLRARGTPLHGGGRGAPASWHGAAAPGGSAGVRAAGWQRGAGDCGGAARQRGGPPGAARELEGGCRRGPGLWGGNGAQAAHGAGEHRPRPQTRSAMGQGTPTPPAATPHHCGAGARGGRGPTPHTLQHPVVSRTPPPASTLAVPGGPSPPHSPFTTASIVPGAGAGGAEMQWGRGTRVGGEAVAVAVAVAAEGLRRAGRGGREVLCGEQRAGCHGECIGMLWDLATPEVTCKVSPSSVAPEKAPGEGTARRAQSSRAMGALAPEGARSLLGVPARPPHHPGWRLRRGKGPLAISYLC